MSFLLRTTFWLLMLSLGCWTATEAQVSRNNNKSPTSTGAATSVWLLVSSSFSTFEIRGGALWACGRNDYGQLGDGTTTNRNAFNCANNICRAYSLPTAAITTYTQPLSGIGNRTDFQSGCTLAASVTASGSNPATNTVKALAINDASVQRHSGHAYVTRHYDILPATNPNTATATITLYFTQAEFTAYNAVNDTDPDLPTSSSDLTGISNLPVSQFHGTPTGGHAPGNYPTTWGGNGPARVLLTPTSVVWNGEDSRWEVSINVTGFSGFFVHGNSATPLPVAINSFAAQRLTRDDVLLSWQPFSPQGDVLYSAERSGDGKDFEVVGNVKPGIATEYSLHDYQPLPGRSYYRLKTMGVAGNSTYSEVRMVYINPDGVVVQVYPSPAKDSIVVENSRSIVSGSLTNLEGKLLMNIAVKSGERINVSSLPAGLYLLRLHDGNVFKIVKEQRQKKL